VVVLGLPRHWHDAQRGEQQGRHHGGIDGTSVGEGEGQDVVHTDARNLARLHVSRQGLQGQVQLERIDCHARCEHGHPQTSPSPLWNMIAAQILSLHKISCILSQHEICYPCTVEKMINASSLCHT